MKRTAIALSLCAIGLLPTACTPKTEQQPQAELPKTEASQQTTPIADAKAFNPL
jgi:hypothetical protein